MRDVEHVGAGAEIWIKQQEALRREGAPVVADADDAGDVLVREELGVVGGDGACVVEEGVGGLGGAAVAELAGDEDAVGELAEVREDGVKEVGAVGEAVEEVEFSYGLYLSQRAEGQALTVF